MIETDNILEEVKQIVLETAAMLESASPGKEHYFDSKLSREIKARADTLLEAELLERFRTLNLPILSEETGYIPSASNSDMLLIIDPLDGTYNYVRGIEHYGISVALWCGNQPLFGVIHDLPNKTLYWGGKAIGAYTEAGSIAVSSVEHPGQAAICTGFPARFDVSDPAQFQEFHALVKPFGKVRMIGSAALALILVCRGSADWYAEKNIMLWDIAAGLAILEGAGGNFELAATATEWSYDVRASNGLVSL
jgi:myo-inositol-1(or 4)-monophosphatase